MQATEHFYNAQRALQEVVAVKDDPSMQLLPRSVTGPLFSAASNALAAWNLQIEALNHRPNYPAATEAAIGRSEDAATALLRAIEATFSEAAARCPEYGRVFNER